MGRQPAPTPGPLALAVADLIRRELGSRKMSGRSLASAIDKSEKYVRDRLNDQTSFSFEDVARICEALSISVGGLMQAAAESLED